MEVMAEANEQPALLNQDVDDVKKPRRTKTAARPRRTTASKTGARRPKKETKDDEPISSETNNHLPLLESRDGAPSQNIEAVPALVSGQPHGFVWQGKCDTFTVCYSLSSHARVGIEELSTRLRASGLCSRYVLRMLA